MANISLNGLTNYNNELKTKYSNFNLEKLHKYSHKKFLFETFVL